MQQQGGPILPIRPIPGRAPSWKALHYLTYPSSPDMYFLSYRRSPVQSMPKDPSFLQTGHELTILTGRRNVGWGYRRQGSQFHQWYT